MILLLVMVTLLRFLLQVRANALLEVGGSPTWTLTEDYALGMQLKKYGWHCRYVQEYLAIGEAPDQIRNCYQQRSRWCKARLPASLPCMRMPCCNAFQVVQTSSSHHSCLFKSYHHCWPAVAHGKEMSQ